MCHLLGWLRFLKTRNAFDYHMKGLMIDAIDCQLRVAARVIVYYTNVCNNTLGRGGPFNTAMRATIFIKLSHAWLLHALLAKIFLDHLL